MPGIGYALGLERILLAMESQGVKFPIQRSSQVFVAAIGEKAVRESVKIVQELRQRGGLLVERDYLHAV